MNFIPGYVVWTLNPKIHLFGNFSIAYYGILFAMGFVIGYYIMQYIFKKENIPQKELEKLTTIAVIATVIGARLGHVFFYDWDYYKFHIGEIFMVWKGGLASHGGAIALLIALYYFSKKSTKKSYLWILDRFVIPTALAGAFIRMGNLMNSEIYGHPTDLSWGFIFVRDTYLSMPIEEFKNLIINNQLISTDKLPVLKSFLDTNQLSFQTGIRFDIVMDFIAQNNLMDKGSIRELSWILFQKGKFTANHPTQIYEALSYFIIFVSLLLIYIKRKGMVKKGFLFGFFMLSVFGMRFLIEFVKEVQVEREHEMILNLGQKLSIPFILIGIFFIWRSTKQIRPIFEKKE
jgi:phosphatidylglycerol:prolipoprotein diacylglycerol transferase